MCAKIESECGPDIAIPEAGGLGGAAPQKL